MAWYRWKYFEKIFDGNYWGEDCGDRKMACCLQVQCHQPTRIILLFGSVGKKSSSFSIKHLLYCYNQSTFILVVIGYKKKLSKINCLFPRKAECSLLLNTAMTSHKYHIKGHKISLSTVSKRNNNLLPNWFFKNLKSFRISNQAIWAWFASTREFLVQWFLKRWCWN